MQKVKNVLIRKEILFFVIIFFSFYGFSQKKEIKSNDDYIVLNETINKYFISKNFRDSLFYNSELYKENPNHKKIKRNIIRRNKNDTLYIMKCADTYFYKQFFKKDARWKRGKYSEKHLSKLNVILNDNEIEHYKKQLIDNFFMWNSEGIKLKSKVFINNELIYTREEYKKLSDSLKVVESRKRSNLEKKLNLYTFSKPIYSKENKYALIAYNNAGTNVLKIFERKGNDWKFIFSLSNNMIISKVF